MKNLFAALILLVYASSAVAVVVTRGNLTTDDTTNYITDTNTGRLYTRFNAFNFTYTETLAAIASGGAFDGWSIATSSIAYDFVDAALGGSSTCTGSDVNGIYCGSITDFSNSDFGASWNRTSDYFVYLNDGSVLNKEAGLAQLYSNGSIYFYNRWNTLTLIDTYPDYSDINYLLYKDVGKSVPEASSIILLAFGLLGLFGRSRQKFKFNRTPR